MFTKFLKNSIENSKNKENNKKNFFLKFFFLLKIQRYWKNEEKSKN